MKYRNAMLFGILASLWAPRPAAAEVTVLGIRSLDGDEALAENLTRFIRTFIASRELDSVSDRTQTLEQMTLIADCPDDVTPACLRDMADALGTNDVIYGFLTRMGEGTRFTYSLTLHRFSASRRRDLGMAEDSFESTRQGTAVLQILVNSMLDKLYDRRAATSLIVQSNEPGAVVTLDGDRVGETGPEPLWITDVHPGSHVIRVEKEGFDPWERSLDVGANEYRLLEAPLTEGQTLVATGPTRPVEPVEPVEGRVGEEPVVVGEGPSYWDDWRTIAGWSAVGGGAVFGGVGIGFTVAVSGINDDADFARYRAETPRGQDACDRASADTGPGASRIVDLCNSGSTYAILQFVMYGLSVAALGTGAYFLIANLMDEGEGESEPESSAGGIAFAPFAAVTGAGISLAAWF